MTQIDNTLEKIEHGGQRKTIDMEERRDTVITNQMDLKRKTKPLGQRTQKRIPSMEKDETLKGER